MPLHRSEIELLKSLEGDDLLFFEKLVDLEKAIQAHRVAQTPLLRQYLEGPKKGQGFAGDRSTWIALIDQIMEGNT